ncbi:hypothetical protein CEXT_473731 [Caerostris extrusa]|uniref:Uncharacterized protein n=1 Tax=Caerostris extrusa TaxID=172846 RepID=A0AAV4YDW8_CAEEX|nr:hypothetical protein CEXT_473731 [Caerostris extrusa]
MLTFCKTLWQKLRMSRSLHMSWTSSKTSFRSSGVCNSLESVPAEQLLLEGGRTSPWGGCDKRGPVGCHRRSYLGWACKSEEAFM